MRVGDKYQEPRMVEGVMILVEIEVVDIIKQEKGVDIVVTREL